METNISTNKNVSKKPTSFLSRLIADKSWQKLWTVGVLSNFIAFLVADFFAVVVNVDVLIELIASDALASFNVVEFSVTGLTGRKIEEDGVAARTAAISVA